MRNRLKSVTGRLMVWATLLLFPQVNEASILEDLIEQLSDRERKGFFIEGNVGVGVLQSTGTSHPDIEQERVVYGTLSSRIGYFFNRSFGAYVGYSGGGTFLGNLGVVYFTDRSVFPPYIYGGIHGSGLGVGGGYPIHPRVYIDGSLSFVRRDAWYSERVGTRVSWLPDDTVHRVGKRTDRIITLGVSYWFF